MAQMSLTFKDAFCPLSPVPRPPANHAGQVLQLLEIREWGVRLIG